MSASSNVTNSRDESVALRGAARGLREWRLMLLLTLLSALLAIPALIPTLKQTSSVFGHSAAAAALLSNRVPDTGFYLTDLRERDAPSSAPLVTLAILLTLLTQNFLAGGVMTRLTSDGAQRGFWRMSAQLFLRNCGAMLLFLFVAALLLLPFAAGIALVIKATGEQHGARGPLLWVMLALALVAFGALRTAVDLGRASMALSPTLGVLGAWRSGWRYFGRNKRRSMSIFGVAFVAALAGLALLTSIELAFTARSWFTIALAGALTLLTLFFRSAVRLAAWGAVVAVAEGEFAIEEQQRREQEREREEKLRAAALEAAQLEEARRIRQQEEEEQRASQASVEAEVDGTALPEEALPESPVAPPELPPDPKS